MITDTDMAKSINDILEKDFPNAKLAHKPISDGPLGALAAPRPGDGKPEGAQPTMSQQIDALIAGLEARIRMLQKLRSTL